MSGSVAADAVATGNTEDELYCELETNKYQAGKHYRHVLKTWVIFFIFLIVVSSHKRTKINNEMLLRDIILLIAHQ